MALICQNGQTEDIVNFTEKYTTFVNQGKASQTDISNVLNHLNVLKKQILKSTSNCDDLIYSGNGNFLPDKGNDAILSYQESSAKNLFYCVQELNQEAPHSNPFRYVMSLEDKPDSINK